jgi:hypothetical protein
MLHVPVGAVRPVALQNRPPTHKEGAESPVAAQYVPKGQTAGGAV